MYTDAGNWVSTTFAAVPGDQVISLATILTGVGAGVMGHAQAGAATFSRVGALELIINTGGATRDVNLSFGSLGTAPPVPEPASMTLLGLGLAGLGARRWRQRRKA